MKTLTINELVTTQGGLRSQCILPTSLGLMTSFVPHLFIWDAITVCKWRKWEVK